jgi:hypothetical protein
MRVHDVEVRQGRAVLNKLGEADRREELRKAYDRNLVDADPFGHICPPVGVQMNVVFFKPGKPIGQLSRVLLPSSHKSVFRDGNGNSDSGILLHNFILKSNIYAEYDSRWDVHRTPSDGLLRPRLRMVSMLVLSHFQTAADFFPDADALD